MCCLPQMAPTASHEYLCYLLRVSVLPLTSTCCLPPPLQLRGHLKEVPELVSFLLEENLICPGRHTTVLSGMWWCVMVPPNGSLRLSTSTVPFTSIVPSAPQSPT